MLRVHPRQKIEMITIVNKDKKLIYAARDGDEWNVRNFISLGVNLNNVNNYGLKALHWVEAKGQTNSE